MPFTPYDHTTDPTAFLVLDDRSAFTMSGSQVTGWSNVSASGLAYDAVTGSGTVTRGTDGGGYQYPLFNGSSELRIPTSSGFDAHFVNTGDSGGKGMLVVFDGVTSADSFFCNKGSLNGVLNNNAGSDNLCTIQYTGGAPRVAGAYVFGPSTLRPYAGGSGSLAMVTRENTTSNNDGRRAYYNGAPSICDAETVSITDGNGYDLTVGGRGDGVLGLVGGIRAVVCWDRSPKHHEVLATWRYYANRYGFAETLTNQPYALVVETNSESIVPQGTGTPGVMGIGPNGEVGPFDRLATALGLNLDACFMLGRSGRSTANMITDWSGDVLPLVEYLQYLGVPPVVIQWEGINDGFVAAHVLTYANLVAASGAKFVTGTSMAKAGIGHSGPTDSTVISAYNVQVLADGAANGYQVAGLGYDPTLSTMANADGTYNSTYTVDGTHWTAAGVVLGVPYFVTAVQASLAAPTSITAAATCGPVTASATLTATAPAGASFTAAATAGPVRASATLTVGLPPADTFEEAVRTYLLANLGTLSDVYLDETAALPGSGPYCILSPLNESPEWTTHPTLVPGYYNLQFSFVGPSSLTQRALRDAAYNLFTPRANGDGTPVNPPLVFNDGGMPPFGSLPGMKRQIRQAEAGPNGQPVWVFMFDCRFMLTRNQ